jgi:hypothetical protein
VRRWTRGLYIGLRICRRRERSRLKSVCGPSVRGSLPSLAFTANGVCYRAAALSVVTSLPSFEPSRLRLDRVGAFEAAGAIRPSAGVIRLMLPQGSFVRRAGL